MYRTRGRRIPVRRPRRSLMCARTRSLQHHVLYFGQPPRPTITLPVSTTRGGAALSPCTPHHTGCKMPPSLRLRLSLTPLALSLPADDDQSIDRSRSAHHSLKEDTLMVYTGSRMVCTNAEPSRDRTLQRTFSCSQVGRATRSEYSRGRAPSFKVRAPLSTLSWRPE